MATYTKFMGLPAKVDAGPKRGRRKWSIVNVKVAVPNVSQHEDLKIWEKMIALVLEDAKPTR